VCPGRLFKNEHMEKEHVGSKVHKRAMKRWEARLLDAQNGGLELESEDARVIVEGILDRLEAVREVRRCVLPRRGADSRARRRRRRP